MDQPEATQINIVLNWLLSLCNVCLTTFSYATQKADDSVLLVVDPGDESCKPAETLTCARKRKERHRGLGILISHIHIYMYIHL